LAALKDGKPRGFTALLGEVSFSHNTLQQHLDRLVAQGFVVKKKTASNNLGRPKFNYRVPSATRMRVPKLIVSLVPLIGVSNEEIRNSRTLFSKVDLTFAQKALNEPFHPAGSPGRPQRNPLGILKAHLVKRLKRIPSDRMLVRQMWNDPRLKKICDIEANEPPYGIAVLSRFRSKIGPERLARIVDQTIEVLVKNGRIKGEALALDSTFIKAYSRRNLDNRTG
jgi:transposase